MNQHTNILPPPYKLPSLILTTAVLMVGVLSASLCLARGVSTYSDTGARPSSSNGGNYLNGNDIRIEADTNAAWIYVQGTSTPAFWDNNLWIKGTGFNAESNGALRFGEGQAELTLPMIWSGNVTLIGDATIGLCSKTDKATGIITGTLASESDAYKLLIRSNGSLTAASNKPGILVITSDNPGFKSPIQVGGGTLQFGRIGNVTATGFEWVDNGDGTETYKQNTAKNFTFDGTTGSVGTGTIDLTCSHNDGTLTTLRFERAGNFSIGYNVTGNGKVALGGTATYTLSAPGKLANTINSLIIEEGVTFVNNRHSTRENDTNIYGTWDYTGKISGSGFYQVALGDATECLATNLRENTSTNILGASNSGFTGTMLASNGYRIMLGSWNSATAGYNLGATDLGQVWMNAANGTYRGDMYLKGDGWSTVEYRGALRFAGDCGNDPTAFGTLTSMQATYGNIYLMGDTRISAHANKATVGLLASDIKNYGDGNYQLEINSRDNMKSRIIVTGTNSYGKTLVNGSDTLQVGHVGTINCTAYDGTTGTIGTGEVTVAGGATLHFRRTNDYAFGAENTIMNNGTIIFGDGGTYTQTAALTNNKTIEVAADTKLNINGTYTQGENGVITGAGMVQMNTADSANVAFTVPRTNNFTGIMFAGTGYRWANPSTTYDIGAVDGGQLWIINNNRYTHDVYLAGEGWNSNERFGALRFATNGANDNMAEVAGNVYLLDDTRISARVGDAPGTGLISGDISGGDYALEHYSKNNVAGTIILTGTNTYGTTNIVSGATLQIGHIGTINGNEYDGSTGTLGQGDATVNAGGTLKFMRSGDVTITNGLKGDGAVILDGSARYTLDAGDIATTNPIQVGNEATVTLSGIITRDVANMVSGTIPTISNATFQITLGENNKTTPALVLTDNVAFGEGNTLSWGYEEGFTPELGDMFYLLSAPTDAFLGVDVGDFQIIAPALEGGYFWRLGIGDFENSMALVATMGVPEPATWVLLLLGFAGFAVFRKR